MNNAIRNPRVVLAVLAALLAALAVSACGGSSSSTGSGASAKKAAATTPASATRTTASAARTAFTACLKTHGVTLPGNGFGHGRGFPGRGTRTAPGGSGAPNAGATGGPPSGGPGGGGFPGGGLAEGNSKFAKAFQACRSKLGSTGFGGGFRARPGGAAGAFRPRFTTAVLKSYVACIRRNGYAAMPEPKAARNGSFFPASVEQNAKFQAANRKCQSILLKSLRRSTVAAGAGGGTYTITGTSTTRA